MVGTYSRFLLLMGVLLTLSWAACSRAESSVAVEGVLVLRNGNVLTGKLLQMQDYYQVVLSHGQLRVPVGQVEFACQNLDEAYEHRRHSRTGATADSHLELARWCLRHEMLEHAAHELLEARSIDPHHRKLTLLERRLQQSRKLASKKDADKLLAETQITPTRRASPIPTTVSDRSEPLTRVQTLRELSPKAKSSFVRQIQPMLLHSCATSGCHQLGSSRQMELNRQAMEGVGNPRAMLANMEAVLVQADRQTDGESALLSYARAAHGADRDKLSQPLSLRQLRLLRAWLLETEASTREQSTGWDSTRNVSSKPLPVNARTVRDDLFDPSIFNRRYGKQKEASKDR